MWKAPNRNQIIEAQWTLNILFTIPKYIVYNSNYIVCNKLIIHIYKTRNYKIKYVNVNIKGNNTKIVKPGHEQKCFGLSSYPTSRLLNKPKGVLYDL